MSPLFAIVGTVLLLFELLLLARAALDWTAALAGTPVPGTVRYRLSATARLLTEPVLGPVRRVLPPLRLGGFAIDTAFLAVFAAVLLLRQFIVML